MNTFGIVLKGKLEIRNQRKYKLKIIVSNYVLFVKNRLKIAFKEFKQ